MNDINVRDPAGKCASDSPGPIEHGGTIASTNDLDCSNSLADLAARIRAEHEGMTAAMRRGVEHAIRAGDLLIEAKAKVPHGQWLPWLAEHVAILERTARLYMRLASNKAVIEQNGNVADLSINRALKLLTAPKPPKATPWNGVRIDVEKGMREELAALVELASAHGGERIPYLAEWLRHRRYATGRWPTAVDVIGRRVAVETWEAHRELRDHGAEIGLYSPWSPQDAAQQAS